MRGQSYFYFSISLFCPCACVCEWMWWQKLMSNETSIRFGRKIEDSQRSAYTGSTYLLRSLRLNEFFFFSFLSSSTSSRRRASALIARSGCRANGGDRQSVSKRLERNARRMKRNTQQSNTIAFRFKFTICKLRDNTIHRLTWWVVVKFIEFWHSPLRDTRKSCSHCLCLEIYGFLLLLFHRRSLPTDE